MDATRQEIEKEVLRILRLINHPVVKKLEENLNLFSMQELLQIYEYIKTGSLNPIYDFFENKKNDYINIMSNIKRIKSNENLQEARLKERLEMEEQEKDLDIILFNI